MENDHFRRERDKTADFKRDKTSDFKRDRRADFKTVQNPPIGKNENRQFCQCVRLAVNKIIIT